MRAFALLAVTLAGLTCRDRALTGPGVVQHGSFAVAPRFAPVPEGGPVIVLASVSAWLVPLSGIGDSTQVTATFSGDSAVLEFEVPLTGPTQQFILRMTGLGAGNVPLYRAVDTIMIAAGSNPPLTGVPMQYVGADAGVTDITLAPNAATLVTGDTLTLGVTALAGDSPFTGTVLVGWTSRDPAAVTVSASGKLTASGTQRPPVWVVARTVQNVADSALITVNVTVASVTLNLDAVTLARGDTIRLVATPRDASGAAIPRPVSWTSLDPAFALVDASGLVRAMTAGGSARIVASSGGRADTAIVTTAARAVAAVVIAPRDTPLSVGASATFAATVTDAQGNPNGDHPLTWTSRTPAVATVNASGTATAAAPGTAYIVATAGGVSDSVLVTVSAIPVASVVITPSSDTLTVGDAVTFSAATFDAQGTPLPGRLVTWTSADVSIATVSQSGLVTAITAGATSIIAASEGRADTAAVLVLAGQSPITSTTIAPRADTLTSVGDTVRFSATSADAAGNPRTGTYTWVSRNTEVASVSATGLVTAVANGTTYIVVAEAGGTRDSAAVLVEQGVASIAVAPKTVTLARGDTLRLAATLRDAGGAPIARPVNWTSLDPAVASVDTGGLVAALTATGTARIVASSGGRADTAVVTTAARAVAAVVISPRDTPLTVGASATFAATVTDAQGNPNPDFPLAWTSRTPTVATVNASGTATAVAPGTSYIVATAGGVSDSVLVTVTSVPVASVVITPSGDTLTVGDTATFSAATFDAQGTPLPGRPVAWSTSDAGIATVSATGFVTAAAPGSASIIASSEGRADTAVVLVVPPAGNPIRSTTISPRADTLTSLGDTARFSAASADAGGSPVPGTYSWASRNDAVATVSQAGVVTARGSGTTFIVVTEAGGTRDSAQVLVEQRVSSVSVTPQTVTRYLGKQQLFSATAVDGRGNPIPGASFTWRSSVPTVASVDGNGNTAMLALGSTNIIATANGITGQAALTVITPITRIAVTPDSVVLASLASTQNYRAIAYDTLDAPMTGVRFSFVSSNPSVAALSGGTDTTTVATASANGTTFVRASAQGVTGGAFLTVSQVVIAIDLTPSGATIAPTGFATLRAQGRDANGYYISMAPTAFRWISDAPTIATVNTEGLVTATGAGTGIANITAELATDSRIVSNPSVITVSNTGVGNRVFFGRDTLAIGRASSNSIPLYLSKAAPVPVIISLVVRDTIGYFPQDVDTIPVGASTINVQLNGRNAGVTELYLMPTSGGWGGDTAILRVQANVRLAGGSLSMVANDQRNDQVLLSDPAPAGGVYVTYSHTTAGVVSISPDPAFIPAGQLAANVVVRGLAAGTTTVTPMAAGVNGQSVNYTISPAVLTLANTRMFLGLGQYQDNASYVYTQQYISTALPVSLTSSDTLRVRTAPTVVTIPSNSNYAYFGIRGFALGEATVQASATGWTPASMAVVVTTPRMLASGGGNLTTTSPTQTIYAYTADSTGSAHPRLNSLVISAWSSDTNVIRLVDTAGVVASGTQSTTIRLNAVGGGSAWVRIGAGGHRPDSVFYTVAAPKLQWANETTVIGTEQQRNNFSYVYTPNYVVAPLVLTVTAADSTIAATSATAIIPSGSNYVYLNLRGHQPGLTRFIVTAPGYTPDTVTIRVSSNRLTGCCDNGGMRMFQPDATLSIYAQDSTGTTNNTLVPLRVSITSTNTAVVAVDSAEVSIGAGSSQNSQARVRAVGGGSAAVILTTPGYRPDTVFYTVTTPKLNFSASSHVIGARQSQANIGYVYTPDYVAAPLVVRMTRSRPDLVQFPDSVIIPANSNYSYYNIAGLATGVDTVIASVAGYMPDTLVIRVSSARLIGANPPANVATTAPPSNMSVVLADSQFSGHASLDRLTIRVQSTDTNVLQLDSQYVHILPGASNSSYTPARWVGPGMARIVYSDSAGIIPPDTSTMVTVTGPSLRVSGTLGYLGTRQRLDGYYVYTDNYIVGQPLVVRLSSSRPDIVQVSDSVIIPVGSNYAYFNAFSLDTIARIRVTLTATGYQATSMEVEVGQARILVSTNGTVNTTTPQQAIYVEAQDHRGSAHPVTQDLVVNLAASNAAVASPDSGTITIRAGNTSSNLARMRYYAVGSTALIASDPRTGVLFPYLPDTVTVTVNTPVLTTAGMPGSIGIGQFADPYIYVPDYTTAPLTVTHSHNAALLDLPASVTIPANSNYSYFRVSGKSTGTDTVRASAAGHVTETRIVTVGPGLIGMESFPSSLARGDSIAIRVFTMNPAGGGQPVLAQETFSLASSAEVAIVSGGANSVAIDRITVAAGQSYSGYFYLKGVSSGTASVTVSNAGRYVTSTKPLIVP